MNTEVHTDATLKEWVVSSQQEFSEQGAEDIVARGYNPEFEADRARLLQETLGDEGFQIAAHEQRSNREAYRREFLEDKPLSHPRTYWHYNSKLYSYPKQHELVGVESGIHPDERNGLTLEGFKRYQEMVADDAGRDEVFIWYSPAGPGGDVKPFSDLVYESGRLYFAFKTSQGESVHFDLKIQEGENIQFPIARLLQQLSGRSSSDLYDYLKEPIKMGSMQSFLDTVAHASREVGIDSNNAVYVSRRTSDTRQTHTWESVLHEMLSALTYINIDGQATPVGMPSHISEQEAQALVDPHAIDHKYWGQISTFAQRHGLEEVTLYGCSTTNIVSPFATPSIFNSNYRAIDAESPIGSIISLDPKEDPNLCRCSEASGAHFHCPGKIEGAPCKHPIVVGKGTTKCPCCGTGRIC